VEDDELPVEGLDELEGALPPPDPLPEDVVDAVGVEAVVGEPAAG